MRSNWQYMILALVLALLSWHLVSGREKVETWVEVPVVTRNTPEGMVVTQGLPGRLEVRIKGSRGLVKNLNPTTLAYELDLSGLTPGENVVVFNASQVPLPGALEVVDIEPARAMVEAEPLDRKDVAVVAAWKGVLPQGWELKQATVEPARVSLLGPQSVLEGIDKVSTVPYPVKSDHPAFVESEQELDLPAEVEADPSTVLARYVFGPPSTEVWVKMKVELPAKLRDKATVSPDEVRLLLDVPTARTVDAGFREGINVTPVIGPERAPGVYETIFRVDLPVDIQLIRANPDTVRVTIPEPEPAS